MPPISTKFQAGESVVGIESVKTAVDVYSPVAGSISATNPTVADKAELLSESAEDQAWLVKIAFTDLSALDKLINKHEYDEFLKTEAH